MKSLQLAKPHLLIVIGVPGSGKSLFAAKFSDTFSAPFVNSGYLWRLFGDDTLAKQTAQLMLDELLKTKQTIIYEPLSGTRAERLEIARSASKQGYEPLLIWVQTDQYVAQSRALKKTRSNPQPITAEEFERQSKRFTAPGPQEKHVVISGMHTYATQARVVLKKLTEHTTRASTATLGRNQARQRRSVMVQ